MIIFFHFLKLEYLITFQITLLNSFLGGPYWFGAVFAIFVMTSIWGIWNTSILTKSHYEMSFFMVLLALYVHFPHFSNEKICKKIWQKLALCQNPFGELLIKEKNRDYYCSGIQLCPPRNESFELPLKRLCCKYFWSTNFLKNRAKVPN